MVSPILARPHSSFKLLVLGVADPFLWSMLLPQKKWTDQKGQSDGSQKTVWNNSSCEYQNPLPKNKTFAAKNETQSLSDPLFSFEHMVVPSSTQSHGSDWRQFLWFHWHSPLQHPEGLSLPWVWSLSRQDKPRPSITRICFAEDQHVSQEHIGQMTRNWTSHEPCNPLQKQSEFFRNPKLNLVAHLFVSKRTWPTLILSDPIWKLGTNECMTTVSALSICIWSDCRNYNNTDNKCDKSKFPNQQQSVTQIAKRGVPQIDEHDVFDGLLHNTSAEADAWISSQDQLPAAAREIRHFRDVVAAKVQNTQRLAQRPPVNGFNSATRC